MTEESFFHAFEDGLGEKRMLAMGIVKRSNNFILNQRILLKNIKAGMRQKVCS